MTPETQAHDVELGTYMVLSVADDNSSWWLSPDMWDEADAAYHHWIVRRIDRVLSFTTDAGAPLLLSASRIGALSMTTPEIRARMRAIDAARKAEAGFEE